MNAKQLLALALTFPLAAGVAGAHENRYARARVVGVEPIYETVIVETPVTSCRREVVEREVASANVAGQTLAGAIVGAAIGRQFGDGRGRDALTVLGAMAGSAVANDRAIRRGGGYTIVREPVERCTTTVRRHAERQITSYWVEYRLRGRNYRMQSPVYPGREIRVPVRS
jgi:uncharacterized protein YcfJ